VKGEKVKCEKIGTIREDANEKLLLMKHIHERIADLQDKANAAMEAALQPYKAFLEALQIDKAELEKQLITLMKKNKGVLFDGTDVIDLQAGSLIREKAKKVSIPKTALAECKKNKFLDVIKVVESLDRAAIETWPDAKLTLIGAARKAVEEFKYTVKNI